VPRSGTAGLNPTMAALKGHFDAGRLAIVQGVGYPQPSFSHEVAQKIWQTGDTSVGSSEGWLARWLQQLGGVASPNAVAVRDTLTLLMSQSGGFVPAFTELDDFVFPYDGWNAWDKQNRRDAYAAIAAGLASAPAADVASMAGTSTGILGLIDLFATVPAFSGPGTYPEDSDLAEALQLTARLLNADIGMRYFHVPWGGFDTHAG